MQTEVETYLNFVKRICPQIEEHDLLKLGNRLTVDDLRKKDYYIHAGNVQNKLGFVISGLVRSFYIDKFGNEQNMRFITDNEYVTDYPALLSYQATKYNFQCLTDVKIVTLPYDAVVESYNCHQFDRFGRIIAEKVLQLHHARVESFLFDTAEERYCKFVKEQPYLFKRIPITHLCSYLGVKRQTLTRIRKKLIIEGC